MGIRPCSSTGIDSGAGIGAAAWLIDSTLPWQQLVGFGPDGFPEYARLRFLVDPTNPAQSETDAPPNTENLSQTAQLMAAVEVLQRHTRTPDELYFCFWDGYGFIMPGARFDVPERSYFLYHGNPTETTGTTETGNSEWRIAACDQAPSQLWIPDPAFIWPADRSWCVANDVDPHWAGIGASGQAIAALKADKRLDIASADPAAPQPAYR